MNTPVPKRNYLTFLLKSKGRHGIHSAFVFNFVDACLTTKVGKNFLTARKSWVKLLSRDKELFAIQDLGAGSRTLNQTRSVAQLIKTASSNGVYGNLLWKIARHYQPKAMLELGTSIGCGAITLKNGAPNAHLITVEGCDAILRRAYEQFEYWKLDGITPINSPFDAFLTLKQPFVYDLVFLDGNHQSEATLNYLEQLMISTHEETLFILDDIRWNDDMWQLWNQLVADDRFHLSIDLGRMGLLWRRKHQAKEHFVIRPRIFKNSLF